MTKDQAIQIVRRDYGNHPCKVRFCRCGWIMCPPSYPGDWWDCMNPAHGISKAPSPAVIKAMQQGVRKI